jgi:hypothetical protein
MKGIKSKRKFVRGLFIACVCIVAIFNLHLNRQKNIFSVALSGTEVLTGEIDLLDDPIILHGCLAQVAPKSLVVNMPFQAVKSYPYIKVYYLSNLSNITVQIVNASGQTVYANSVNPVAGGHLYISLANLSAGDYTIVFTAPNGNSIYGDFEI